MAEALRGYNGANEGGPFLLANMTEFGKTPIIPLAKVDFFLLLLYLNFIITMP